MALYVVVKTGLMALHIVPLIKIAKNNPVYVYTHPRLTCSANSVCKSKYKTPAGLGILNHNLGWKSRPAT